MAGSYATRTEKPRSIPPISSIFPTHPVPAAAIAPHGMPVAALSVDISDVDTCYSHVHDDALICETARQLRVKLKCGFISCTGCSTGK